jgi:hypothetical protein
MGRGLNRLPTTSDALNAEAVAKGKSNFILNNCSKQLLNYHRATSCKMASTFKTKDKEKDTIN